MSIIKSIRSWKTTVLGVLALFGAIAAFAPAVVAAFEGNFTEAFTLGQEAYGGAALVVGGLIGIFSKDGDKTSEDVS